MSSTVNAGSDSENKDKWPSGISQNSISAESAIVMELNTGTILYEKNIHDKRYPASITKIMTTLLCLENASLTDIVKYSSTAVNSIEYGSSHIGIVANEELTMEDSLYGIMLMSANEACNGVAEHVAGSISGFVDMMNERAEGLGCLGTHFANPNGLYLDDHYTTAYDMALISREAMKNSVFRKITGTKTYTISETNLNVERPIHNKHNMLYPIKYPKYGYDYCIGGKTGYTDIARWTLVTFAKKDDMELVCVVMKTAGPPPGEPNEYTDTTTLLNYAFDKFTTHKLENDMVGNDDEVKYSLFTNYNTLFDEKDSPLYIEENAGVVLPNKVKLSKAKRTIEYYNDIKLEEGINTIGKITYSYAGKEAGTANIYYDTTKVKQTNLNEELTNYVYDMSEEKVLEENQKEIEKQEKEEQEKKSFIQTILSLEIWQLVLIGFVFIIIIFLVVTFIIRAQIRKKYFGSYRRRRYKK